MKINHPTASQQGTLSQDQITSAPLVLVTRENPAGGIVLQALADLSSSQRLPRDDGARHRRSISHSGGWTNSAPAPALHDIIGRQRVSELDANFGSLQPPLNLATDGIKDWEREGGTSNGKPLMHPLRLIVAGSATDNSGPSLENLGGHLDLEGIKSGEKKYMWAVSALGRLFIGEELPAGKDPETGEQKYLGHPTLVGGGPARMSGDLRYNHATGKFVVSNRSGRYSRYEDRPEAGLQKVADIFSRLGLEVQAETVEKYRTRKVPAKLVLPSLAPKYSGASEVVVPKGVAAPARASSSGAALAPAEAMASHGARDFVDAPDPRRPTRDSDPDREHVDRVILIDAPVAMQHQAVCERHGPA